MGTLKDILISFIPIFVAVDAIGVLPIFTSLTHDLPKPDKRKIIISSMITASCVAIGFIFLGQAIFKLLSITISDFMIAGGAILFCIAIIDIINPTKKRRNPGENLGAVPIGTPLIAGPAVLTTSLIIISQHGTIAALISVISNILLAGLIFSLADIMIRVFGVSGSRALSKIMSLFLAAIAVMMIRKGILLLITQNMKS